MNSFQSRIIKLKVAKKPDKRNEELLPQDNSDDGSNDGWFSSITNKLSSGGDAEAADEAVEAETPAEEARRARARRGRKVAPKRKFRKTNRKTSRKSKTRRFRG